MYGQLLVEDMTLSRPPKIEAPDFSTLFIS